MRHRQIQKLIAFVILTCLLLGLQQHVWAAPLVFEARITASESDAEESSSGVVTLAEDVLDLGGYHRKVGLRFANIAIPPNSAITRAYIEFNAADQDAETTKLEISGQASDNALAFTTGAMNIYNRPCITPVVEWNANFAWQTVDQVHQSADLAVIVQKIVNRPAWQSGNAMAFIITGIENKFRRARSWNADPQKAPKLHIEYTPYVIDVRVTAGSDDMYHYKFRFPDAVVHNNDAFVLGDASAVSGLRFQNVNIPQGAYITYACLKFVAKQDTTQGAGSYVIYGEKRLSPPTFSTNPASPDSVGEHAVLTPTTTSNTYWGPLTVWNAGQTYVSAEITSVIQEIVGQAGWDGSDKSLALSFWGVTFGIGDSTWSAWSYDGDPNKAPLLHIEYGQPGSGDLTPSPIIVLGPPEIGHVVFQGAVSPAKRFDLTNAGALRLNYSIMVGYDSEAGWLSLTPAAAGGQLDPGQVENFAVNFNTAGLAPGVYGATIRLSDPSAHNSPKDVRVSLTVTEQGAMKCGDIPIYSQNLSSAAVLVLLDLSSSMLEEVHLLPDKEQLPRSSDIRNIVQEIVNRDGWQSGNAMAFFIEHLSGSSMRYAQGGGWSTAALPYLQVTYDAGGGPKKAEARVIRGSDSGNADPTYGFIPGGDWLYIAEPGTGKGSALRFENISIPKRATIQSAYLMFVPTRTDAGSLQVKITGEAGDNPPTFAFNQPEMTSRLRTTATATWDLSDWTAVTKESKINIAKSVISELFKDTSVNWGFGTWVSETPWLNPNESSPLTYTLIEAGCKPHSAAHQARLQAAVAATGNLRTGSTPFSPSFLGASRYFAGQKRDNNPDIPGLEDGDLFQDSICQPKFLIEVTDGIGNVDSDVQNTRERAEHLADMGISAVGIGMGLSLASSEQLYVLADVANTRGKSSTDDMLYALHEEDLQGRPVPYLSYGKNDFMKYLGNIMSKVKAAVFYGSAPAATTSTDLGDMVLVSSFKSGNWTGELEAIGKSASGAWNSSLWKASAQGPAVRSVWTVSGGSFITAYSDGTLSGDNYLCKKLGDIVNSTPVVVGTPPFFYSFDGYQAFKRHYGTASPREKMVYVGANDGLLHAFSLNDGSEKWAFLPRSLQAKLDRAGSGAQYDMCSSDYCHQYLLDGTAQVADVFAQFGSASRQWRTMLVIGQRQGGTAYSALDVTSGESPASITDPARFLWEFSDGDLGESWADAAIERVTDATGQAGATTWGVFFSSGYSEVDNLQPNKEAYLFGLQADSGAGLWNDGTAAVSKIKVTAETGSLNYANLSGGPFVANEVVRGAVSGAIGTVGAVTPSGATSGMLTISNAQKTDFQNGETLIGSLGHQAKVAGTFTLASGSQKNNALNSPLVANFNPGDHTEDCIYVGDLYGSMFRVNSIGKGQTPSVSRLFKFNPYPTNPEDHPIRGKATYAFSDQANEAWVYFGTGRFETAADRINATPQYFFGLKDTLAGKTYSLSDLSLLQAQFTSADVGGVPRTVRTISGANASAAPWAIELFSGKSGWGDPGHAVAGSERVFTKPLVVGGIAFFTTFIPDTDMCSGTGETWVFAVDYKTGLPPTHPVFDVNGDKKFTDADKVVVNGNKVVPVGVFVGRGQGSGPVLFKDTLFVNTSVAQEHPGEISGNGAGITGLNALLVNIPQKRVRVESWKHN